MVQLVGTAAAAAVLAVPGKWVAGTAAAEVDGIVAVAAAAEVG